MRFTCDRCQGEYPADQRSAVARLYVKDARCNHLEARCAHCGAVEVIFLGPQRIEEAVREGELTVRVAAQAGPELRVRAERAWAAAEGPARRVDAEPSTGGAGAAAGTGTETRPDAAATVKHYRLTPRHEQLLAAFAQTLGKIPDDLLWDEISSEHDPRHPERWTD